MITGSHLTDPTNHVLALKAVQSQADRYLTAVYGSDYGYRAPETYVNLVERWMYSIVTGGFDHGDNIITQIEELAARQHAAHIQDENRG